MKKSFINSLKEFSGDLKDIKKIANITEKSYRKHLDNFEDVKKLNNVLEAEQIVFTTTMVLVVKKLTGKNSLSLIAGAATLLGSGLLRGIILKNSKCTKELNDEFEKKVDVIFDEVEKEVEKITK